MPTETKTILSQIANTIRGLALDAIDAANSGHPGLPLGCGEIMAVLYGRFLRHDPSAPNWRGRDRFILSAGHGSMALYSSLHLAGFGLSIEDLKKFRQLHSPTAGHPEFGEAAGIETTTGPLGQGIATAVGLALADKHVAARTGTQALLTNQTVVLVGDGCIMEGISAEASSLAGHLKLDNLIVIYDSNDICLDGPISETLSEDVSKRYSAYGWHVTQIDGHDIIQVENALDNARNRTDAPSLIIAKTTIGKGSPKYEGSSEAHGKAFGPEESLATKHALGITNTTPFSVQDEIYAYFTSRRQAQTETRLAWESAFSEWAANHSE
ncbi:transketolase, partial [bacterium]|nr:transketolase [bacterium]